MFLKAFFKFSRCSKFKNKLIEVLPSEKILNFSRNLGTMSLVF